MQAPAAPRQQTRRPPCDKPQGAVRRFEGESCRRDPEHARICNLAMRRCRSRRRSRARGVGQSLEWYRFFAEGSNLKAWLFTILRNAYFSELRKRKREVSDSDGELTAQLSVPPEQQGHVDLADLRTALSTLPSDQREALVLVGAEGFSYEEAAEITGCALGTIKSRVSRGRARLSEVMGFETGEARSSSRAPAPEEGERDDGRVGHARASSC